MTGLADLVTVLFVTSPTEADPTLDKLHATFDSVFNYTPVAECPFLIGCDGIRPEQEHLRDAYVEKVGAIRQQYGPSNVVALPRWGHQANVLRALLDRTYTPLVLFMEHDTPLTGDPIDWDGCVRTVLEGGIDSLRFHYQTIIHPLHLHLALDTHPTEGALPVPGRVPYIRTMQWSQRPHLARADWYRELLATYFDPSSRTMIEDVMHGVVQNAVMKHGTGSAGWGRFRLAVYAPTEPNMLRSLHLDGRGSDPKYPCVFAYPGDWTPEGAPLQSNRRVGNIHVRSKPVVTEAVRVELENLLALEAAAHWCGGTVQTLAPTAEHPEVRHQFILRLSDTDPVPDGWWVVRDLEDHYRAYSPDMFDTMFEPIE